MCGECHVRLDGILHCRECLGATERSLQAERPPLAPRIGTLLTGALLLAPALLLAFVVLRGFGFGAGRIARWGAVAFEQPVVTDGDEVR